MTEVRLTLTREQILGHRRRVSHLESRLPYGASSLRQAGWAGLQDSMPRAALLSVHARVEAAQPTSWDDPAFEQVWGPRFSTYVVPAEDRAIFTVSRLPETATKREICTSIAARLRDALQGETMLATEAAKAIGEHHNQIRRAAATGTILIRWDGARQPTIWSVPAPDIDPVDARLEMARRYIRVFGPTTAEAFAGWAGISKRLGPETFARLSDELTPVVTPIGDAVILSDDEDTLRRDGKPSAVVRLLPSGDTYYLVSGIQRDLILADKALRNLLWTSRVWPGAVLMDGEIVGIWRRAQHQVVVETWRRLSNQDRDRVEAEASALPLPDLDRDVTVTWNAN